MTTQSIETAQPRGPAAGMDATPILEVSELRTYFYTEEGEVRAVDGVTFSVPRAQIVAIVGESGCGKSVTAYSVLRLIQKPGRIVGGSITLHPQGRDPIEITELDDTSDILYDVRGGLVSMIFQEPMTALSPVHTIGDQLTEAILLHQDKSQKAAEAQAIEMLSKVGIPGPGSRMQQYPFELSGGMRQRVVIAMAMVCNPQLLIADEPTTALDVTIQAQVMKLMQGLRSEFGTSILLITHDLGVVAQMADEVAVMYLGRIVEQGHVRQIMKDPRHPYTMALLKSLPGLSTSHKRLPSIRGSVPSVTDLPPGCPFHPRCDHCEPGRCDVGSPPPLKQTGSVHRVACLRADEIYEELRQDRRELEDMES